MIQKYKKMERRKYIKKVKRKYQNIFNNQKFKLLFFFILLHLYLNIFFLKFQNKQPSISDIINDEFSGLIHRYKFLVNNKKNISDDCPIWVMQYQGIENAPPIVKACIKSIIINAAKHPVIILNKNNLNKYLSLPSHIMKKYNKKLITTIHLSDIIRMGLLSKHGEYWIDSTYFLTSPLSSVNYSLFTLKTIECYAKNTIHNCRWAMNFIAVPKKSFIAIYIYKALLQYWKKYNNLVNYFLIDYLMYSAYDKVESFKNLIDKHPYIVCNIFTLSGLLDRDYNKELIKCNFNKLSYKRNFYNDSRKTIYRYIIDEYKLT